MAAAYTETGSRQITSTLYVDTGTGTAACNAVFYAREIETEQYRGIEYVVVQPYYGVSDADVYWRLPITAPSRELARPAIHHSPRRHIAPIHFRHVRCQQRQREHRSRS